MSSKLFYLQLAIILCCYAATVQCMLFRPSKCGISSDPMINRKPSDAVTKEEVCSKLKNESVLFIDIRQKWELKPIPPIPKPDAKNFMHISLYKIDNLDVLQKNPEDFEKITGYAKPSTDQEMIIYCHSGRRSTVALEIFRKRGYENAKHFPGSASYWKCLKNEGFCPNI